MTAEQVQSFRKMSSSHTQCKISLLRSRVCHISNMTGQLMRQQKTKNRMNLTEDEDSATPSPRRYLKIVGTILLHRIGCKMWRQKGAPSYKLDTIPWRFKEALIREINFAILISITQSLLNFHDQRYCNLLELDTRTLQVFQPSPAWRTVRESQTVVKSGLLSST